MNFLKQILQLFILLFAQIILAQNITSHSPVENFSSDNTYYLFGDNVKLRESPNTNSAVIDLFKIGTKLIILNKTEESLPYNGINSFFYKVQIENKVGYILGGLIAKEKINDTETTLLFSVKQDNDIYYLLMREIDDNGKIIKSKITLDTPMFLLEFTDNKGLLGINNILYINYLAEACGVNGGGIYLFKSDDVFKEAIRLTQTSDAGVYWINETLTFPNDEDGVKGKIIFNSEQGESKDESTNWIETTTVSRELEWKENALYPKL